MYHRRQDKNRSIEDATHAWVEAYLPSFGWVGFDPTNAIMAGEQHIRAAVGRDYADVPPTRGTFKGDAESELAVAVTVEPTSARCGTKNSCAWRGRWARLTTKARTPSGIITSNSNNSSGML